MRTGGSTHAVKFPSQLAHRVHNVFAPEEGYGHATPVDVFSGVNETPLLRGIEFTHAPSQAGERVAKISEFASRKIADNEPVSKKGAPSWSAFESNTKPPTVCYCGTVNVPILKLPPPPPSPP